jgi:hypothetical protein
LFRKSENGTFDQKPIRASGREIFISGDDFAVNAESSQPAYLYLLNESLLEGRNTIFYLAKFKLDPRVAVSTPTNEADRLGFDKNVQTEQFWFIYSEKPLTVLEKYKNDQIGGNLPPDETALIKDILLKNQTTEFSENRADVKTIVKGSGGIIAYKAELRHY